LAALLALAACETPPPAKSADGAPQPKSKGTVVTGSRLGSKSDGGQPDVQTLSGTGVQDAARGHPGSPFGPQ
jgi:hypothetical protein